MCINNSKQQATAAATLFCLPFQSKNLSGLKRPESAETKLT